MKIEDAKNSPIIKNSHDVRASKLYDTEHAQVVHITLDPGEKLKKHITPVDVFFYILEGNPDIEIGDEKVRVQKDNLIESLAMIPHCIYNEGDTVARILVTKVPRPVKKTKIL